MQGGGLAGSPKGIGRKNLNVTMDPRQETASDVTRGGADGNAIETQMERRLRSTIAREENVNSNSALN